MFVRPRTGTMVEAFVGDTLVPRAVVALLGGWAALGTQFGSVLPRAGVFVEPE